jgi:hypothetical protein
MTGLYPFCLGIRCIHLGVVSKARHDTMSEVLNTVRLELTVASSIGLERQLDAAKWLMHSMRVLLLDLADQTLEDIWAHVAAGVEFDGVIRHDVMWWRAKKIMKNDRVIVKFICV